MSDHNDNQHPLADMAAPGYDESLIDPTFTPRPIPLLDEDHSDTVVIDGTTYAMERVVKLVTVLLQVAAYRTLRPTFHPEPTEDIGKAGYDLVMLSGDIYNAAEVFELINSMRSLLLSDEDISPPADEALDDGEAQESEEHTEEHTNDQPEEPVVEPKKVKYLAVTGLRVAFLALGAWIAWELLFWLSAQFSRELKLEGHNSIAMWCILAAVIWAASALSMMPLATKRYAMAGPVSRLWEITAAAWIACLYTGILCTIVLVSYWVR